MKGGVIFLVLILAVVQVSAAQERVNDFYNYSSIEMNFVLSSNFTLVKQSDRARVESVRADLSFYPNGEQEVRNLRFNMNPFGDVIPKNETVSFVWDKPADRFFSYEEKGTVIGKNDLIRVRKKVPYPIAPVFNEFTQATEFIDMNVLIQQQARDLAEGEDDLFMMVFKIAAWVGKNIRYDLGTLTAPVVQKSSWVLQNREGVCDELTNLFISMVRSRGIPARFISGLAYSNAGYGWGPHAWAEVYFPNVGWVPFDVTYGQFGWVDPSHIRLKAAVDSGEASVKYSWKAVDAKFKSGGVALGAELVKTGEVIPQYVILSVRPLLNKVGPGSYVPLEVSILNTQQAYVPVNVIITKAQELTEKNVKQVLLLPGEEKKVYWMMKIPNEVDAGFKYTSIVEVQDGLHYHARTTVAYAKDYKTYTLEDAQRIMEGEDVEQTYVKYIDVRCKYKEYAFSYEKVNVQCTVTNKGDTPLLGAKACLGKQCSSVSVDAQQQKQVRFTLAEQPLGFQTYDLILEGENVRKKQVLGINVVANPDMVVTDFKVPDQVDYGADTEVSFVMQVKAPVKEVQVFANDRKVIVIPDLLNSKRLILKSPGSEFVRAKRMDLRITYKDDNGKQYTFTQKYPMNVVNVPVFVQVLLFLRIIQ